MNDLQGRIVAAWAAVDPSDRERWATRLRRMGDDGEDDPTGAFEAANLLDVMVLITPPSKSVDRLENHASVLRDLSTRELIIGALSRIDDSTVVSDDALIAFSVEMADRLSRTEGVSKQSGNGLLADVDATIASLKAWNIVVSEPAGFVVGGSQDLLETSAMAFIHMNARSEASRIFDIVGGIMNDVIAATPRR